MVLVPAPAVGAVGTPVNAGLIFCVCTNAVVAICVVEVVELAVGAIGYRQWQEARRIRGGSFAGPGGLQADSALP